MQGRPLRGAGGVAGKGDSTKVEKDELIENSLSTWFMDDIKEDWSSPKLQHVHVHACVQ